MPPPREHLSYLNCVRRHRALFPPYRGRGAEFGSSLKDSDSVNESHVPNTFLQNDFWGHLVMSVLLTPLNSRESGGSERLGHSPKVTQSHQMAKVEI